MRRLPSWELLAMRCGFILSVHSIARDEGYLSQELEWMQLEEICLDLLPHVVEECVLMEPL